MTNSYNNRNSSTESVEVTQVDRDAAADWHHAQGNWIVDYAAMRRGEMDGCGTVQAFARHRQSSIPNEALEAGKRFSRRMADACDRTKAHRTAGVIVDTRDWHALMSLAEEIRAALASLKERNQ